jgi:hypothetical protein
MARKKKQHGNAVVAIDPLAHLSYYQRKKLEREQAIAAISVPEKEETDAEISARIAKAFKAMDQIALSTVMGDNKSLVVSGPPGLGKSYTVMHAAEKAEASGRMVHVVKGFVRSSGLYRTLYENRFPQCVVVFDDADSVFENDVSLNILKTACDITRERKVCWLAEIKMLDEDGDRLPRSFHFEGSVIFISNYDFDSFIEAGSKLAPHMKALISRSQYVDLDMKTTRDCMIRIRDMVRGGMLRGEGVDEDGEKEILEFIEDHKDKLRELSLRMVEKIANTRRANRFNWRDIAFISNVPASKRR